MARGSIILVVSISRVILVGWRWISLRAFAMWFVIGRYWDGVSPDCELLFFGFLRIRYEIHYQGAHHNCHHPEL
jgi:hypothetical protein